MAPVWFIIEDDCIVFMTMGSSVKGRNLQRDSRVMICVDDDVFPCSFVVAEGAAAIEQLSPAELLPWSLKIASRYVPADRADSTARRNAVDGELLVRVPLRKLSGTRNIAA